MEKTYAIAWQAKTTGRCGLATKRFDREEAESLADELNRDYPHYCHEAVDTRRDIPSEFLSSICKRMASEEQPQVSESGELMEELTP